MALELILGPMFSGKTTELFRRLLRCAAARENCLLIKYDRDNRYSESHASTHDEQMLNATSLKVLKPICDNTSFDVIGIDEGQFYPDIVEAVNTLVSQGKRVIISALDGDFMMRPFGDVLQLVPKADSVIKLNAVCALCHKDASFTRRISAETQVEVIGGADKYVATCRKCFNAPFNAAVHEEAQKKIFALRVSN